MCTVYCGLVFSVSCLLVSLVCAFAVFAVLVVAGRGSNEDKRRRKTSESNHRQ